MITCALVGRIASRRTYFIMTLLLFMLSAIAQSQIHISPSIDDTTNGYMLDPRFDRFPDAGATNGILCRYTITATAEANGAIAPAGVTSVNTGENQSYIIMPATGYHVANVLVDGFSAGPINSYIFTIVTCNHTISASFEINTYSISATAGANGSITPSGVSTINYGGSLNYTIIPATGYHIADVLIDGVPVGPRTSYEFTNIAANHIIHAYFAINTYTITSTAGANGSITPSGTTLVNYGSNQHYNIAPLTGYHVTDVVVDGFSVGAQTSYDFISISTDHTIEAYFAINTYTITATAIASGSVIPPGVTTVTHGSDLNYTITPNLGSEIVDVLIDNISIGPVSSYKFTNITSDHTITGIFVPVSTLILSKGWNLVSVPRVQSDYNPDIIFPDKDHDIYAFNTTIQGYELQSSLMLGAGYWVHYKNQDTVVIRGPETSALTIDVYQRGWVLVGSRTAPIDASLVQLSDGAEFFGDGFYFEPILANYVPISVIQPGKGYWFYVTKACTITIPE